MTPLEDDRLARVVLCQVFEPGDYRLRRFVAELGTVGLVAALRDQSASGVSEIVSETGTRIADVHPERTMEQAARVGARFVVPDDPEWPGRLADLDRVEHLQRKVGEPVGLWVRGPLRLDQLDKAVAVVGSRSATMYGVDIAAEISAELAREGCPVVSGGAYGIDQAAHRGALAARGQTVVVLAGGVDRPYPSSAARLIDAAADSGAVVSELPPGCTQTRTRFLARNRVIAAMGRGTVVVEASVRSGALNTANWTQRLHRPVLGVPGSVRSAASEGVHELIRGGGATLVTSAADVLEMVSESGRHLAKPRRAPVRARDHLGEEPFRVLEAVPVVEAAGSTSISRAAGLGLVATGRTLVQLEKHGLVEQVDGGWRQTERARSA